MGKRKIHGKIHQAVLENLEQRNLFSTINVASFGAVANDGNDDSGAIMAAINSSKPGDTILFSGGIFNINGSINVPGDRTYLGQNGGGLQGADSDGKLMHVKGDNFNVENLSFNGGGLYIDQGNGDFGYNRNILIDNNIFNINAGGNDNNCITANGGLEDTKITNNSFTGYNGQFGIYGYNYMGLTIANNELVNIEAGMHIDSFGNSGNLLVEQNYLSGIRGMGMEFQGTSNHDVFQDNWYEHPDLSSDFHTNDKSFAYSLILDKSSDIVIQRNTVIAPERPDGTGCRIGFEVGGDNCIVQENYINGVNHTIADNDGEGSSSVNVKNNKILDYFQTPSISFGASDRTFSSSNNNANTQLNWNINRGLPGRNKRLGLNAYINLNKTLYDPKDFSYLTDMAPDSTQGNWSASASNGDSLSLNNRTYAQSVDADGNSTITYQLNGNYSKFFSDIAVDDSVGSGSVDFQVFADGVKVYDSGTVSTADPTRGISLRVDGVKQLQLVTTGASDNNVTGDWAAPRLITPGLLAKYLNKFMTTQSLKKKLS